MIDSGLISSMYDMKPMKSSKKTAIKVLAACRTVQYLVPYCMNRPHLLPNPRLALLHKGVEAAAQTPTATHPSVPLSGNGTLRK